MRIRRYQLIAGAMTAGLAYSLPMVAGAAPAALAGLPLCQNSMSAVSGTSNFDVAEIRAAGYAGGTIGGIDLGVIDQVTRGTPTDVFSPPPNGNPPAAQTYEVAGALVSLTFPGLENGLLGTVPTTDIGDSAFPVSTSPRSLAGAQNLSVVFNGRVIISLPVSVRCQSVTDPNLTWTLTIPRVQLDGYAVNAPAPVSSTLAPYGLGSEVSVTPGDTSSR